MLLPVLILLLLKKSGYNLNFIDNSFNFSIHFTQVSCKKTFQIFYPKFSSDGAQGNFFPAWPTHCSNAFDLFKLSSFNKNGCKFPNIPLLRLDDIIHSQDSSVSLPDYFMYCLFKCARKFCNTHLNYCSSCGAKSHSTCFDKC